MKKKSILYLFTFMILSAMGYAASIITTVEESAGRVLGISWIVKQGEKLNPAIWAKLLLWIGLFTVMYYVTSKFIFEGKEHRNSAIALALVISLIATIGIPSKVLFDIFNTYAIIVVIMLLGFPVLGVYLLGSRLHKEVGENNPRAYHAIMMAVFYITVLSISAVTMYLGETPKSGELTQFNIQAVTNFGPWFDAISAVAQIFFAYHLIAMIFFSSAEAAETEYGKAAKEGASGIWSGIKDAVGTGATYLGAERRLGRNLAKSVRQAERSSDDIKRGLADSLDLCNLAITKPEKAEGAKEELLKHVDDLIPSVRTDEGLEHFEEFEKQFEKFNTGYIAIVNKELVGEEDRYKKKVLPRLKDPEVSAKINSYINKLKEEVKFAEGVATEIANIKKKLDEAKKLKSELFAEVTNVKDLISTDKFSEAYRAIQAMIAKEDKFKGILRNIADYVNKNRALIAKQRKDFRSIRNETKGLIREIKSRS